MGGESSQEKVDEEGTPGYMWAPEGGWPPCHLPRPGRLPLCPISASSAAAIPIPGRDSCKRGSDTHSSGAQGTAQHKGLERHQRPQECLHWKGRRWAEQLLKQEAKTGWEVVRALRRELMGAQDVYFHSLNRKLRHSDLAIFWRSRILSIHYRVTVISLVTKVKEKGSEVHPDGAGLYL